MKEVNRLGQAYRDRHEETEDEADHCGWVSGQRSAQVWRGRRMGDGRHWPPKKNAIMRGMDISGEETLD